jgi:nitronate monooxygenase
MTDVSGIELVAAGCAAGIIGAFPTHNAASPVELERWLDRIGERTAQLTAPGGLPAPVAANLVVHRSNTRLAADLDMLLRASVEVVITSIGSPREIVAELQSAGITVLADVASLRHAERGIDSGVDGLVLLTAGAGGQTGWANPFAFLQAVRRRFDGIVVLAGGVSDGAGILAAQLLGADLAYLGTRFIATTESLATPHYRNAVVAASLDDVSSSTQITGLAANVLTDWLRGYEQSEATGTGEEDGAGGFSVDRLLTRRGVWAAGHSVSGVHAVESVAAVVARLAEEIEQVRRSPLIRVPETPVVASAAARP